METADDGLDFSAAKAREWRFQLIGGFKEMCDGCFVFREVFRGMGSTEYESLCCSEIDRLCVLLVRVPGYRQKGDVL
jgi:hypothetical protein